MAWVTLGCDTAVTAVQFCGEIVSGTIAAVRRLFIAEKDAFGSRQTLWGRGGAEDSMGHQSPEVYEAIQSLSYLMLEDLIDATFSNSLYAPREEWEELDKSRFRRGPLSLVQLILSKSATKARNII